MERIIYPDSESGLAIVSPSPNATRTIEEIRARTVPKGVVSRVIEHTNFPEKRIFRNAWRHDFESDAPDVVVDMDKARVITQDMIREERKPLLEKLDIEYQRATETENKERMQEVVALKQVLRDLPASSAIQEAQTPDELEHLARNSVKEAMGE